MIHIELEEFIFIYIYYFFLNIYLEILYYANEYFLVFL